MGVCRYWANAAVTMDDASVLVLAIASCKTEFSDAGMLAVIFGIGLFGTNRMFTPSGKLHPVTRPMVRPIVTTKATGNRACTME